MMLLDSPKTLRGKRVLVMGLGLHGGGVATTNWLVRHGARVTVTDLHPRNVLAHSLRDITKRSSVTFVLGKHRHQDFRQADVVVQNPGVPSTSPFLQTAAKHNIPVVNEATLFFAFCPCPVIGITGTKGKSTVSSLIAHFLKSRYRSTVLAGNIRTTAMLDVLDDLRPSSHVVVELSSWQLEGLSYIKRSPHIAVLTNLLDDHLNQYATRRSYHAAKELLWRYQTPGDITILNRDNPPSRVRGKTVRGRRLWFSLHAFPEENGAYVRSGWVVYRMNGKEQRIVRTSSLVIPGEHNVANLVAAVAVARLADVPAVAIARAVPRFHGVPDRLETIRRFRGVTYVNDTTATAPAGVIAALSAYPKNVVLIAGGQDKQLQYGDMARAIKRSVRHLILFPGTATDKLVRHLRNFSPVSNVQTMAEAVRAASRVARTGDVVMLSPGAASFNMFQHEFDRGEQFRRAVKRLS